MQDALHDFIGRAGGWEPLLARCLLILLVRHCLSGFLNIAITALVGIALIWLVWRLKLISAQSYARAKLLILLLALVKGAFYLVLGDNRHVVPGFRVAWALQVPDPGDVLFLRPQSQYTIWNPTWLTYPITSLLCGIAFCLLLGRTLFIWRATRHLETYTRLNLSWPGADVTEALRAAAAAMGFSPSTRLPTLILADLVPPAPMLLGVFQPRLLLPPLLVSRLTSKELEMIIRHELAHFKRRDHWWRWLLTWIQDVGWLNILSVWIGGWIIDQQEELCDMLAVQSAKDALSLAHALRTASDLMRQTIMPPSRLVTASLPSYIIPSFLGLQWTRIWRRKGLEPRLSNLAQLATKQTVKTPPGASNSRGSPWRFLSFVTRLLARVIRAILLLIVFLLLVFVVCIKYRLLVNLPALG